MVYIQARNSRSHPCFSPKENIIRIFNDVGNLLDHILVQMTF